MYELKGLLIVQNPLRINIQLCSSVELLAVFNPLFCFTSLHYRVVAPQRLPPISSYKTANSYIQQTSSDTQTVPVLLYCLPSMKWQRTSVNKWLVKSTIYSKTRRESKLELKTERLLDEHLSGGQKKYSICCP